jgi:tetratricopeptide (TPR) repeat protein
MPPEVDSQHKDETRPAPSAPPLPTSEKAGPGSTGGRGRLWGVIRWYILGFLVIVIATGAVGYLIGVRQREAARQEAITQVAKEQFDLSLEDLDAGRFEIARQRLEYVIQIDPSYPDAPDRLAQALLALNRPTSQPTAAASPTPNLSPVEDLYDQARASIQNGDWSTAIDTLVLMKSKDAGYKAVERDGLMYLALRNRGIDLISNQGELEQGIYDLSRAEQFGPLDRDAANWRSWAQLYLQANSYMGLNWAKAAAAFAQVYLVAPYLKNDAYIKYAISAQNYGDQLMNADDPCAAEDMYDESLAAWDNATLYPTATKAHHACKTATAQRPKPKPPTDTPTPEGGGAPTDTPEPSATPDGNGS